MKNARPLIRLFGGVLLFTLLSPGAQSKTARVHLFPKLHRGQTIAYYVTVRADKQVYTQSPVISATPANDARLQANSLLHLEILDLQTQRRRTMIHARLTFGALDPNSAATSTPPSPPAGPSQKFVEFTFSPGGNVTNLQGFDTLSPEQQQAFQEWLSRFALTASFPSGAKLGQRWKSQQLEPSPSPIAGLRWIRQSTYVRDEPCHALNLTAQGDLAASDAAPDTCAVILTTATLTQRSKPTNATPETFKLHELRTAGAAHGTNRAITYISLKTGLLVRSTQEADQGMDVTIAKADRSNRVRYNVAAKSNSEVLLVSEPPLANPK